MNSQDLETARRCGIGVVVLVLEDGEYGFIAAKQETSGFERFGIAFNNPDFVRYAEAYGLAGYRAADSSELEETLERAFSGVGPAVVSCPISYRERFEPSSATLRHIEDLLQP